MPGRRFFSLFLIVAFALSMLAPSFVMPGAGFAAQAKKNRKPAQVQEETGEGPAVVKGKKGAQDPAAQKGGGPSDSSPGQINARAAILIEVSTGTVLFEQNADEPIEPASFTKILTLFLVQEALKEGRATLADEVYVSTEAWRTGGSKMFVADGSRVPLEELLKGIAVVSGNDACVAVAEHLYGSLDAFVDAMNRKAKELGMNQSRFMNPHGLPADGQITTARDMGTLDLTYLQRFPDTLKYHSMREYSYNNINQYNRNHLLLKDPSVDGLKTGYVAAAGYHLSATSQRDGMRLLAVVMGAATPGIREREAMKLLNYGFRHFTLVQPFQPGAPVTKVKVWKGEKDDLDLFASDVPSFLVPQAQKKQLRWEVKTENEVVAPVTAGQKFGELTFFLSDEAKRTVSLVSREDIPLGGIFKRMWQSVLQIRNLDWRWLAGIGGVLVLLFIVSVVVAKLRARRRSTF